MIASSKVLVFALCSFFSFTTFFPTSTTSIEAFVPSSHHAVRHISNKKITKRYTFSPLFWPIKTAPTTTKITRLKQQQQESHSWPLPKTETSVICSVGILTAILGFLYGKVLDFVLKSLWHRLPQFLTNRLGLTTLNPLIFSTTTCTVGGLLVALLTIAFYDKNAATFTDFGVANFVSDISEAGTKFASLLSLIPLLVTSLLTSAFGFSVGPEAPMVAAGGLVGAAVARNLYGGRDYQKAERLAYAGAAGTLTAFMGIPLAGPIFALEMTSETAGFGGDGDDGLPAAMVSSLTALAVLRVLLNPQAHVGGHFSYGSFVGGSLSGMTSILGGLAAGVLGGVTGTAFVHVVGFLKKHLWNENKYSSAATATNDDGDEKRQRRKKNIRSIQIKVAIGALVGLVAAFVPQTLFWGEGSLQSVIDGQATALEATKHGVPAALTSRALVSTSVPFASSLDALTVAMAKFGTIALAAAGKFPGGNIFPLFFAAAPLARAFIGAAGHNPAFVMGVMAATQAAVTRTPLATILILSLSASSATPLSVMLPTTAIASYLGVWVSQRLSKKTYFQYGLRIKEISEWA